MKLKYKLWMAGFILLVIWQLKPLFEMSGYLYSDRIARFAWINCRFGFKPCDGSILINNTTDFAWDEVYLVPMEYESGGIALEINIPLKNAPQVSFQPGTDLTKMDFFFKGKNVGWEPYHIYNISPFAYEANQIVFSDGLPREAKHDVYFRCTPEKSRFKILKLLPAEQQWPGKLVLAKPENCEVLHAPLFKHDGNVSSTP